MARLSLAASVPDGDVARTLSQLAAATGSGGHVGGHWVLAGQAGGVQSGTLPLPAVPPRAYVGATVRGDHSPTSPAAPGVWVGVDGFFTNHAALATDLGLPAEASPSTIAAGAYERWGEGCLPRLDGQWALILLDVRRGRVLAARDHLGVGQLYFAQHGELVLVASEPKSVAAAEPGGPVPEPIRLGEFLNGFPPATMGLSFFRGVRSVPAGAALHIALSSIGSPTCKTVSYWHPQTLDGWTSNAPPFDEAVLQFEVMLADAVRDRSFEGHSGTLLSGGLDSSVVAALAAECVGPGNHVPSFSILHSDPELTEERWVGAVVRHLGLESHVRTIRPADAWEVVDAVVSAQGEPLLGQDLIGQWLAYTLAAEGGVPAVFDGIGADELLGGVGTESWYVREQLRRGNVIEFARELSALGHRHGISPLRAARRYLAGPVRREVAWKRHRRRYAWISRELPSDPFAGDLRGDVAPDASLLNRYLYRHVRHQNAPAILARLDRCASAHGVRALVPFLDRRLVEWCLPAPDRYKVFRGQPKRLLHAVARRHLPLEVADRTDKKAIVSSASWMPLQTTYADAIRSVPLERRVRECGWIDAREAGRFIEAYCAGRHADHLGVWRLYTASRWLELFALG